MVQDYKVTRRVVTAIGEDGKSYIAEDGPTPAVRTVDARPGYVVNNIWVTGAAPAPVGAPDAVEAHEGVLPPAGGTVLRVIEYPPDPEDPEEMARQFEGMFGKLFEDAGRPGGENAHPGMHITETVDYAIVIEGEITAIMENEETVLGPGDVLIQRGTNHAWTNRSGKPARVAFVLISGRWA
ncbi:MAG: cupin [Alphaproteobacteria bacterium]|nr:cupin [Alphaproteobacteria bacterium]